MPSADEPTQDTVRRVERRIVCITLVINLAYAYFVMRPQFSDAGHPAFNIVQVWNAFWALPFSLVDRAVYGEFTYSTWHGYAGAMLFLGFTWLVASAAIKARRR